MAQKIIKVGSSSAVTIPKKILEELRLKTGDAIVVETDKNKRGVFVRSVRSASRRNNRVAKLTTDFINRYRKDLEALAHK